MFISINKIFYKTFKASQQLTPLYTYVYVVVGCFWCYFGFGFGFSSISKWAFSEMKGSVIFQSMLGVFSKTQPAHKENNQNNRKEISFTKLITMLYTTK